MIDGAPKNKLKKIEIVNDTETDMDLSENVDLLFHKELEKQGTPVTSKTANKATKTRKKEMVPASTVAKTKKKA